MAGWIELAVAISRHHAGRLYRDAACRTCGRPVQAYQKWLHRSKYSVHRYPESSEVSDLNGND